MAFTLTATNTQIADGTAPRIKVTSTGTATATVSDNAGHVWNVNPGESQIIQTGGPIFARARGAGSVVSVDVLNDQAPTVGIAFSQIQVTGQAQADTILFADRATPGAPATGQAKMFGQNSSVKVRNSSGTWTVRPTQWQHNYSQVMPYDPTPLVTTGTPTPPIMVSGVLHLVRLYVDSYRQATRLYSYVHTAGSGLVSGQCFMGLYDFAGNLLGQTSDLSTSFTTVGGKNSILTTPLDIYPGTYFVGALVVGTTPPRLCGFSNSLANFTGSSVHSTIGSGQTALPSTFATGSAVASGNAFFLAIV